MHFYFLNCWKCCLKFWLYFIFIFEQIWSNKLVMFPSGASRLLCHRCGSSYPCQIFDGKAGSGLCGGLWRQEGITSEAPGTEWCSSWYPVIIICFTIHIKNTVKMFVGEFLLCCWFLCFLRFQCSLVSWNSYLFWLW